MTVININKKRWGPSIEPGGSPHLTDGEDELKPMIETIIFRLDK